MTNIELAELLLQYPEMDVKLAGGLIGVLFDLTKEDIKQIGNYILLDI